MVARLALTAREEKPVSQRPLSFARSHIRAGETFRQDSSYRPPPRAVSVVTVTRRSVRRFGAHWLGNPRLASPAMGNCSTARRVSESLTIPTALQAALVLGDQACHVAIVPSGGTVRAAGNAGGGGHVQGAAGDRNFFNRAASSAAANLAIYASAPTPCTWASLAAPDKDE